jgi:hypothetical protein
MIVSIPGLYVFGMISYVLNDAIGLMVLVLILTFTISIIGSLIYLIKFIIKSRNKNK